MTPGLHHACSDGQPLPKTLDCANYYYQLATKPQFRSAVNDKGFTWVFTWVFPKLTIRSYYVLQLFKFGSWQKLDSGLVDWTRGLGTTEVPLDPRSNRMTECGSVLQTPDAQYGCQCSKDLLYMLGLAQSVQPQQRPTEINEDSSKISMICGNRSLRLLLSCSGKHTLHARTRAYSHNSLGPEIR